MPLALQFTVERRVFFNDQADLGTSPTLALEIARQELQAEGYIHWSNDPETGAFYGARQTRGYFEAQTEGNLTYQEFLLLEGPAGDDFLLRQLRQLDMPIGTAPMLTTNPMMALHPLGLVAPGLARVRRLIRQDQVIQPHRSLPVYQTPKWTFQLRYDEETGLPSEIVQRRIENDAPMRRTRYEGWHEDERTGLWRPKRVISRTFKGDENAPIVELIFTDLVDMEFVAPAPRQP